MELIPKRLYGLSPKCLFEFIPNRLFGSYPQPFAWDYFFLAFGVAFIVIPFLAVAFLVAVFSSTFTSAFGFSMSTSSTVKMRAS